MFVFFTRNVDQSINLNKLNYETQQSPKKNRKSAQFDKNVDHIKDVMEDENQQKKLKKRKKQSKSETSFADIDLCKSSDSNV